jgi:hypothetical protein
MWNIILHFIYNTNTSPPPIGFVDILPLPSFGFVDLAQLFDNPVLCLEDFYINVFVLQHHIMYFNEAIFFSGSFQLCSLAI